MRKISNLALNNMNSMNAYVLPESAEITQPGRYDCNKLEMECMQLYVLTAYMG